MQASRNVLASIDLAGRLISSAGPGVASVAALLPGPATRLFPRLAFKFARSFTYRHAIIGFRNGPRSGRAAMHQMAFLAATRPLSLAAVDAELLGDEARHPPAFPARRRGGLVMNIAAPIIAFKPSNLHQSLVVGLRKRFFSGIAAGRSLQHAAESKGASRKRNQREKHCGRDKRNMSEAHAAPFSPQLRLSLMRNER